MGWEKQFSPKNQVRHEPYPSRAEPYPSETCLTFGQIFFKTLPYTDMQKGKTFTPVATLIPKNLHQKCAIHNKVSATKTYGELQIEKYSSCLLSLCVCRNRKKARAKRKNKLSDVSYEVLRKYGAKKRQELSKETGYPTDGLSKHLLYIQYPALLEA